MAKVMIVDDEDDIRRLVKMTLEDSDLDVIEASNGEEALWMAKDMMPDLILLDVVMPGKTGLEVCSILKRDPKTSSIPVLLFTVLGRNVDKDLGIKAGADGHIVKPFTAERLIVEVNRYLERAAEDKFSRQLGLFHSQITGRKILLEVDPMSQYERPIADLITEARANKETMVVVTRRGSTLHRAVEGNKAAEKFILPYSRPFEATYTILKDHPEGRINIVLDSLTDLVNLDGFEKSYALTRTMLEQLSDDRITALFLLNPKAHSSAITQSFKSLFGDHLTHREGRLKRVRWLSDTPTYLKS